MKQVFLLLYIFILANVSSAQQINPQGQVRTDSITNIKVVMKPLSFDLLGVVIRSENNIQSSTIAKLDMQFRPLSSSQDLLRMVPGLFIAQHAGGGKAEQIFMRGFDVDHGTDFAIYVDGMPVNMPSHAHGQGYADLHFLIPETVKELEVNKGPYETRYGDLATSGSGEFRTLNTLDKNQVKIEYGMYNTRRMLAMLNLLGSKHLFTKNRESWYIAGEHKYTDSYFSNKQDFQRMNLFSKYHGIFKDGSSLTMTLSTFQSSWNASGQIPERKVLDGSMSEYGSIDPSEGGKTGRSNASIVYTKPTSKGVFKNQCYYSRYDFNLYSNFTFFLRDTINGDQINQGDHRNLFGYISSFQGNGKLLGKKLQTSLGSGARYDIADIQLNHTKQRVTLNEKVNGKLNQVNAWLYADENIDLTKKLKINLGTRLDLYNFQFRDHLHDSASGNVIKALVSPKLNIFYTWSKSLQFFAKSGYGFHSNDARAVVVGKLENTLPRALGYEAGAIFKPFKRMLVNVALWGLNLESELVYVGDEGIVEAAGRTRRIGIDLGMRYQLTKYLYIDADLNMNKGRLVDQPKGANHIPLAPTFTSTGGITYKRAQGFNGSLRYRYMGDRAATEDNSIKAKGYFLLDGALNYTIKRFQFGVIAENLLSSQWKEAQFATLSRLKNEEAPVNEIHYTPGTPFSLRVSVGYSF